jgi:hypothetical protein
MLLISCSYLLIVSVITFFFYCTLDCYWSYLEQKALVFEVCYTMSLYMLLVCNSRLIRALLEVSYTLSCVCMLA